MVSPSSSSDQLYQHFKQFIDAQDPSDMQAKRDAIAAFLKTITDWDKVFSSEPEENTLLNGILALLPIDNLIYEWESKFLDIFTIFKTNLPSAAWDIFTHTNVFEKITYSSLLVHIGVIIQRCYREDAILELKKITPLLSMFNLKHTGDAINAGQLYWLGEVSVIDYILNSQHKSRVNFLPSFIDAMREEGIASMDYLFTDIYFLRTFISCLDPFKQAKIAFFQKFSKVELGILTFTGISIFHAEWSLFSFLMEQCQLNPDDLGSYYEGKNCTEVLLHLATSFPEYRHFYLNNLSWLEQVLPVHPYKNQGDFSPLGFVFSIGNLDFAHDLMNLANIEWGEQLVSKNPQGLCPFWSLYLGIDAPRHYVNLETLVIPGKLEYQQIITMLVQSLMVKESASQNLRARTVLENILYYPFLYGALKISIDNEPGCQLDLNSMSRLHQLIAYSRNANLLNKADEIGHRLCEISEEDLPLQPLLNIYQVFRSLTADFNLAQTLLNTPFKASDKKTEPVTKQDLEHVVQLLQGTLTDLIWLRKDEVTVFYEMEEKKTEPVAELKSVENASSSKPEPIKNNIQILLNDLELSVDSETPVAEIDKDIAVVRNLLRKYKKSKIEYDKDASQEFNLRVQNIEKLRNQKVKKLKGTPAHLSESRPKSKVSTKRLNSKPDESTAPKVVEAVCDESPRKSSQTSQVRHPDRAFLREGSPDSSSVSNVSIDINPSIQEILSAKRRDLDDVQPEKEKMDLTDNLPAIPVVPVMTLAPKVAETAKKANTLPEKKVAITQDLIPVPALQMRAPLLSNIWSLPGSGLPDMQLTSLGRVQIHRDLIYLNYLWVYFQQMHADLQQFITPGKEYPLCQIRADLHQIISKVSGIVQMVLNLCDAGRLVCLNQEIRELTRLHENPHTRSIHKLSAAYALVKPLALELENGSALSIWNQFISFHIDAINSLRVHPLPYGASLKDSLGMICDFLQHQYFSVAQTSEADSVLYQSIWQLFTLVDTALKASQLGYATKIQEHGSHVAYRFFPNARQVRSDLDVRIELVLLKPGNWKRVVARCINQLKRDGLLSVNGKLDYDIDEHKDFGLKLLVHGQAVDLIFTETPYRLTVAPRVFPAGMLTFDFFQGTIYNPRGSIDKQILFSPWIIPPQELHLWLANANKLAYIMRFMAKTHDMYLHLPLLIHVQQALKQMIEPDLQLEAGNALTVLFSKPSLFLSGFHQLFVNTLFRALGMDPNARENKAFLSLIHVNLQEMEGIEFGSTRPCKKKISAIDYIALLLHHLYRSNTDKNNIIINALRCLKPEFLVEVLRRTHEIYKQVKAPSRVTSGLVYDFKLQEFYSRPKPSRPLPESRNESQRRFEFFISSDTGRAYLLPTPNNLRLN